MNADGSIVSINDVAEAQLAVPRDRVPVEIGRTLHLARAHDRHNFPEIVASEGSGDRNF